MKRQCLIRWSWDVDFSTSKGTTKKTTLGELLKIALDQAYFIHSAVVTEYDETGHPLHAIIIALPPQTGGTLH